MGQNGTLRPMPAAARNANLLLAFLLELAVYVAAGWWGFTLDAALPVRVVAGLGAPLALAAAWAVFASPRALRPLRGPARAVFEGAWFGAGVAALATRGLVVPAVLLAVLCVVSWVLGRWRP
jgi:hypothetical protein